MTNRKRLMTIAIMAISLSTMGLFMFTQTESDHAHLFSANPFVEETKLTGVIQTPNGNFAIPGILAEVEASNVVDTMFLTDEPANWFKSESLGAPLTIINPGEAVEFDLNSKTDTKHTVSLLVPATELLKVDQSKADDDTIRVQFDKSGIHLFACKVHPYMSGIVVVLNDDGTIPAVSSTDLPFIDHLGATELPATLVASILTNIAPFDEKPAADPFGITLDKESKWDILKFGDDFHGVTVGKPPAIAGIGEIWIDAQFEKVDGQTTSTGQKPGSITVISAETFEVTREMNGVSNFDGDEQDDQGKWNNPHNMWTNTEHTVVYNGNWFGNWLNLIDMETGDIKDSITVGKAPTHIVTIPTGDEKGILTLPLSAEDEILKIEDRNGKRLKVIDHFQTGSDNNHPHGQWITADGTKILIPNVFQNIGPGLPGIAGSVTIMDAESGDIIRELTTDDGPFYLPVAVGITGEKGYISNIGTGIVSVINLNTGDVLKNIQVACFNPVLIGGNGTCGSAPIPDGLVLDTLKLPIQTPASPDGKFVVTAVFSLVSHINPDTIAVIDTETDELVAELPCPAGCHGVNWGAKSNGGYYAYITSQHANVLTVVDPKSGADAEIVAVIPLGDEFVTDGTGGQGVLPLPHVTDGWIQDTVTACDAGKCSTEVTSWINQLEPSQKDPSG